MKNVLLKWKDSKFLFPTGYTTGNLTYSGQPGNKQVLTMEMGYTLVTGYKNGKAVTENGSIPIVIQAELAAGATTVITGNSTATDWNFNGGVSPLDKNTIIC